VSASWIAFRFFLQGKSVGVPNLVGRDVEESKRLLADKGLDFFLESDLAAYDESVPAERIRTQSPRSGAPVKQGATIRVALSLGPRILEVPDLTGASSRTAALQLERLGLKLGSVTNITIPGISGVVSQDPPSGQRIGPAESVSILVAREVGSIRRILPDFVGRDLDRARADLEAFGYRVGTVRAEAYEGVPENRILRQFPLSGFPVAAGYAVSFVVSRGSAIEAGRP